MPPGSVRRPTAWPPTKKTGEGFFGHFRGSSQQSLCIFCSGTSLMLYLLPRHCSDQQCCAVTCIWVLLKPNCTGISPQLRQTLPFPDSTNGCTSSCRTGCKECIDIGNKGSRSSFDWQHPKHTYFGGKMLGAVQVFDLLENRDLNWCIISPSSFSGGIYNTIKL